MGTAAGSLPPRVRVQTLPSTSPANARMSAAAKAEAWQRAICPFLPRSARSRDPVDEVQESALLS